jgi:hypothetical protein
MEEKNIIEEKDRAIKDESIKIYQNGIRDIIKEIPERDEVFFMWGFLIKDPKADHKINMSRESKEIKYDEDDECYLAHRSGEAYNCYSVSGDDSRRKLFEPTKHQESKESKESKKPKPQIKCYITDVLLEHNETNIISLYRGKIFTLKRDKDNKCYNFEELKQLLLAEKEGEIVDTYLLELLSKDKEASKDKETSKDKDAFDQHIEFISYYEEMCETEYKSNRTLIFSFVPFIYEWFGEKILFMNTIAHEIRNGNLEKFINNYKDIYTKAQKYTHKILEDVLRYNGYMVKQASIKSAIAAIMSRNMSHNLGSHLITNVKNYIGRESEKPEYCGLAADLRGIRHLLQYAQERMDYIATITSGDRYPFGSINFKAQLFDELTIDDFSERHGGPEKRISNFFLKYLVFSEKYSRDGEHNYPDLQLLVKYIDKSGKEYDFNPNEKGLSESEKLENEIAKKIISKLNLATPGGIMSRHAFFNIIENIIRNSAKHSKTNEEKRSPLKITIEIDCAVRENYYRISIYDDKKNKKNVKDKIEGMLNEIKILTDSGTLEKSNKGIKEMLISALWLEGQPITEKVIELGSESGKIQNYFKICENKENFGYSFDVKCFKPIHYLKYNGEPIDVANILEICADVIVCHYDKINIKGTPKEIQLNKLFPRFIKLDDTEIFDENTLLTPKEEQKYFKQIVESNIKESLDNYQIDVGINRITDEKIINIPQVVFNSKFNKNTGKGVKHLVFVDHLYPSADEASCRNSYQRVYAKEGDSDAIPYVDSISGGDFTITLTQYAFLEDVIQKFKVIESALTKITIIDERIFEKLRSEKVSISENIYTTISTIINDLIKYPNEEAFTEAIDDLHPMVSKIFQQELTNFKEQQSKNYKFHSEYTREFLMSILKTISNGQYEGLKSLRQIVYDKKNIFIYDIDFQRDKVEIKNLSNTVIGTFNTDGLLDPRIVDSEKKSRFVSIHLGLIEKYKSKYKDKYEDKDKIAENFIEYIKETFGDEKEKVFITIHSGRGNFSKEIDKELPDIPFLSLSSLEAALDNSKYLLSQLFYNNIYYGKSNFNND